MASSKFIEIMDVNDLPYSRENVSLEDVLAETRRRSQSTDSTNSSDSSKSTSPTSPIFSPPKSVKTGLRRLSIMKKP
jgi:hypothetical protein